MTNATTVRPLHPQIPALVTEHLPAALDVLRTRLRVVEAAHGDDLSVGDVRDQSMVAMREHPVEAVSAAIALWDHLTAILYTPDMAARLPAAPYRGPEATDPWNVRGYRYLPAAVVLAGEAAITEALAGTLDPAAIPDPGVEAAYTVYETARLAAADWCHRTIGGRRGEKAYGSICGTWDEFAAPAWGGVTLLGLWATSLGWLPFTEADMRDKELVRFAQVASKHPLTYTRRYPSSPANARVLMFRPNSKRSDKARHARVMWVSFALSAINNTLGDLTDALLGADDNPASRNLLFTPPAYHPLTAEPSVRSIDVFLTAGVGLPPESGLLPGLGEPFPEGTDRESLVKVKVTRPCPEDLRISIALPPRTTPAMEDVVVGVVRIVADTMLTHIPDLTDHARAVLTGWRNSGPHPFGGLSQFTEHIDRIVALAAAEHGRDWPTSTG